MSTVTTRALKNLIASSSWPCLSFYLPASQANEQIQQGPIRLKNLVRTAEKQLHERAVSATNARDLLEPIRELVDDKFFWQARGEGLAIFRDESSYVHWRLPSPVQEWVWLGERPYVKPLFPLLDSDGRYYVLAVSQNRVQLFEGSQETFEKAEVSGLPDNLDETLHFHEPEGMYQVRSGRPSLRGKESMVFHGQGNASEHAKQDLAAFFREIDRVLTPYLRTHAANAPLVFSGVDYLFPIYREVNSYPHLHPHALAGDAETWSDVQLHERACALLAPWWIEQQRRDARRLEELKTTGLASIDVEQILSAACEGRVEALFVTIDGHLFGRYDRQHGRINGANDLSAPEDLLNLAAIETFMHGGRVHAVNLKELPVGILVSALFRY